MADAMVCTSLSEGVCLLRMTDERSHNSLTDSFCMELVNTLDQLGRNPDLRVLILTGGRDVFCAGGSLETLHSVASGDFEVKDLLLPRSLLAFPVPVIGALRGDAVGGGLALALCCDILIAAENRRYGANFMRMGFTPGMGVTALLPALAGYQLAAEMMFTAKFYKGRELAGRGLFAHVVAEADVEPRAQEIAQRIADKPRPVLQMLKEHLAMPRRLALSAAISQEHSMHKLCFRQQNIVELIDAGYLGNQDGVQQKGNY